MLQGSLYFIVGSIFGSFLNVVIYRLPRNLSIISPRSFCPECSKMIPFYRNIPIISYILQMGKCNHCSGRISIRYPIVEIISAFTLLITIQFISFPAAILFYWMFVHLLVLSFIDQKWMKIPISILISMALGLILYHLIWTADLMVPISGLIVGIGFIVFVVRFQVGELKKALNSQYLRARKRKNIAATAPFPKTSRFPVSFAWFSEGSWGRCGFSAHPDVVSLRTSHFDIAKI